MRHEFLAVTHYLYVDLAGVGAGVPPLPPPPSSCLPSTWSGVANGLVWVFVSLLHSFMIFFLISVMLWLFCCFLWCGCYCVTVFFFSLFILCFFVAIFLLHITWFFDFISFSFHGVSWISVCRFIRIFFLFYGWGSHFLSSFISFHVYFRFVSIYFFINFCESLICLFFFFFFYPSSILKLFMTFSGKSLIKFSSLIPYQAVAFQIPCFPLFQFKMLMWFFPIHSSITSTFNAKGNVKKNKENEW